MAISDFLRKKSLDVASVSGTPTISRTVCLKITSGDDSTTGTGEIVLDWTNIASKADIGVYDENDNLLDYYFESFDETDEKAVIWVYRDWVQDGSTQLQIAYGDGPSDQSVAASTVFDKETDLVAGYLFNESSGDLLDVTSNNNDGTVIGATQGEDGIVGGAYSFDGINDYVDTGFVPEAGDMSAFMVAKVKTGTNAMFGVHDGGDTRFYIDISNDNFRGAVGDSYEESSKALEDNAEYHVALVADNGIARLYINGIEEHSFSYSWSGTQNDNFLIGSRTWEGSPDAYFEGIGDTCLLYNGVLSFDDYIALCSATKSSPDFFSQQAGEAIGATTLELSLETDSGSLITGTSLQGVETDLLLIPSLGSVICGYELTLSEVNLSLTSTKGTLVFSPITEPILYGGSRSLTDVLECRSLTPRRTSTTRSDKLTNVDRG